MLDRQEIDAGALEDQLRHRAAGPGRRELDLVPGIIDAGGAEHVLRHAGNERLGEAHHRAVIDIGLVELERGEFGIVPRRQPFVAEVAVDLEQFVGEPADQQPLQMQLRRDPEIEIEVERVVVGDERLGRGAAGDRVQHRRLDLEIALGDEAPAQRGNDLAAPAQGQAALLAHDQIEIALAIARLDVGEAMMLLGQRQQRLRENLDLAAVDGELAARRAAHDARRADDIADIEEPHERELLGRKVVLVIEDRILPEASWRSTNMPLLRIARTRPATETVSCVSVPGGSAA